MILQDEPLLFTTQQCRIFLNDIVINKKCFQATSLDPIARFRYLIKIESSRKSWENTSVQRFIHSKRSRSNDVCDMQFHSNVAQAIIGKKSGASARALDSPESRIIGRRNAGIEEYPFAVRITCGRSLRTIWHLENRCSLLLLFFFFLPVSRQNANAYFCFPTQSQAFLQRCWYHQRMADNNVGTARARSSLINFNLPPGKTNLDSAITRIRVPRPFAESTWGRFKQKKERDRGRKILLQKCYGAQHRHDHGAF